VEDNMKDTRQYTKEAKRLMLTGDKIILRTRLHNGNIVERNISPVSATIKSKNPLYSDVKTVYEVIDKDRDNDLVDLDFTNTRKISKENLQSTSTKNGMLIPLLEVLLISGYVVCNN
jgi:hypothetical protein